MATSYELRRNLDLTVGGEKLRFKTPWTFKLPEYFFRPPCRDHKTLRSYPVDSRVSTLPTSVWTARWLLATSSGGVGGTEFGIFYCACVISQVGHCGRISARAQVPKVENGSNFSFSCARLLSEPLDGWK